MASTRSEHLTDPRVELEDHYYNAAHTKLVDLGLVPHLLDADTICRLAAIVHEWRDDVDPSVMDPTVEWRTTASPGTRRESPATLPGVLENVGGV